MSVLMLPYALDRTVIRHADEMRLLCDLPAIVSVLESSSGGRDSPALACAILPETGDEVWKELLNRLFNVAQHRSHQCGAWWHAHGLDDYLERFATGESQLGVLPRDVG